MKFTSCPGTCSRATAVFSAALITLASASAAFGQNKRPAVEDPDDELVQLDVFEVRTRASDNDYMQTETTTGTRVATRINDLPFQVQSITSEFLQDFDILSMSGNELASTVSGLQDVSYEDKFTMRGAETNYTLRDGFFRLGLIDRSNIDTMQVIKGPSASMYGQTMPTGIVNFVSKRPKSKNYDKASLNMASGNTVRFELEDNKKLIGAGKLNNIFTVGIAQSASWRNDYGYKKTISLYDALAWKITPMTQLVFQIEWTRSRETDETTYTGGAIFNKSANNTNAAGDYEPRIGSARDINKELTYFSMRGPGAFKNRELVAPTLILEHRFNQVWSGRMAGFFYYRRAPQLGTNTTGSSSPNGALIGPANAFGPYLVRGNQSGNSAFIPGVTTSVANNGSEYVVSKFAQYGGAIQGDLTATYRLFNGKVKSTSVIMVDYNTNRRMRRHEKMSNERYLELIPYGFTGGTVYLNDPDYNYYSPVRSDYTMVNRNDDTNWQDLGINIRQQLFMFNEKVRFFAGLRYDNLWFNNTYGNQYNQDGSLSTYSNNTQGTTANPDSPYLDPASALYNPVYSYDPNHHGADIGPGRPREKYSDIFGDHALLPSMGINVQVMPWAAPFFNYSESFTPNSQNTSMGNSEIPDERGKGIDYGVKFNFFDQTLWLTINGYWLNRDHVKTIGSTNDPLIDVSAGGTQRSQGVEVDLNWRVIKGIQIMGNYGYCDSKILSNPVNQDVVGLRVPNIPLHAASLALKYQFPEPLKGLSITPRLIYVGQSFPNTTNTSNNNTSTMYRNWEVPGFVTYNVGMHYNFRFPFARSVTHSLSLTIKNIFDRQYINQKGVYQGDGRTCTFSYKASF